MKFTELPIGASCQFDTYGRSPRWIKTGPREARCDAQGSTVNEHSGSSFWWDLDIFNVIYPEGTSIIDRRSAIAIDAAHAIADLHGTCGYLPSHMFPKITNAQRLLNYLIGNQEAKRTNTLAKPL